MDKTIFFTKHFKKQVRDLKRKFPNIKEDLLSRLENIDLAHEISIGKSVYKIRINSSDLKKGKSGGFRAYIYMYKNKGFLIPLFIYSKGMIKDIDVRDLKPYIDMAILEISLI